MFYAIYNIPYALLTSILGVFGGAIATAIVAMGILRCSFLCVLLCSGDMARFKSEQTEGLEVVKLKIKAAYAKVTGWFK